MVNDIRNVIAFQGVIERSLREKFLAQRSKVFWLTGLSGAGKSTIAHGLEELLFAEGRFAYVFDGDNIRHGLCRDLGFSQEDRKENIRRIAEMLRLFLDAGIICIAAFISPLKKDREMVREIIGSDNFIEIFISCSLAVCEQRDIKGFYKLARAGTIKNYTGVSSPYEPPSFPDLIIETDKTNIKDSILQVYNIAKQQCFF
ncbi:adenylyl-sulfate kinase [Sulfurospirillum sp. MES]|uniref:adenylyl-sulfate kinase n=1 Tax=Sulfurospirillum sp. MES TaxID=1565314 RepID=UPI000544031A|nr:adenylyl-sulfate kinase [Sulfurospirillum sp. MES]KHG32824.1 MAG: adenylylsulfate kinase [Sulfurospirillum sp. MES]